MFDPAESDVSQCFFCKHKNNRTDIAACAAFPDGIPPEILDNEFDHRTVHPAQKNSIVFERG